MHVYTKISYQSPKQIRQITANNVEKVPQVANVELNLTTRYKIQY